MINKHLTLSGSDCDEGTHVSRKNDCRTWLSIVMCRAVATGTTRTKTYIHTYIYKYNYIHIHTNTMFSPKKSFRASPCFVLLSENVGCPVCVVLRMSLQLSPGLAVGAGKPQSTHKLAPVPSSCRFLAQVPAFVYGYSEPKHIVNISKIG